MNHKGKVKLARKLITPQEILDHIPLFDSEAWMSRKKAIKNRIIKKQNAGAQRRRQKHDRREEEEDL